MSNYFGIVLCPIPDNPALVKDRITKLTEAQLTRIANLNSWYTAFEARAALYEALEVLMTQPEGTTARTIGGQAYLITGGWGTSNRWPTEHYKYIQLLDDAELVLGLMSRDPLGRKKGIQ